jgi:hypothetical protein
MNTAATKPEVNVFHLACMDLTENGAEIQSIGNWQPRKHWNSRWYTPSLSYRARHIITSGLAAAKFVSVVSRRQSIRPISYCFR